MNFIVTCLFTHCSYELIHSCSLLHDIVFEICLGPLAVINYMCSLYPLIFVSPLYMISIQILIGPQQQYVIFHWLTVKQQ